jgi:hypothetical protein
MGFVYRVAARVSPVIEKQLFIDKYNTKQF